MGEKDTRIQKQIENENRESNASGDAKFDFITETIKEKPVKKHIFRKIVFSIFLGALFGFAGCVAFLFSEPIIKQYIKVPDDRKIVTFPEDETEETAVVETPREKEVVKAEAVNATENEEAENKSEENPQVMETEEIVPEDKVGEPVVEETNIESKEPDSEDDRITVDSVIDAIDGNVVRDLEVDDVKLMYGKLNDVAKEASRAIVTVTGLYSDVDWFSNPYESSNQTTGLIIADNGRELLILAQVKAIADADSVEVTFCNGTVLPASIKKSDRNTELAIVAVELVDISVDTMDEIKMARLGTSTLLSNINSPVIALGNPTGIQGSMTMGQITGVSYVKDQTDTNIHFITTDIFGSTNANGILMDLDGKVLGIIYQDSTVTDTRNLIKAYGISDLKPKIEKLSNGQDFAYLGVIGTDVTEDASEQLGVPMGAYIKEVELDSPAMKEGLRSGDVIVKMGTADIKSFDNFKDTMLKCQPGDLMMITVKRLGVYDYVDVSYEITLGTLE